MPDQLTSFHAAGARLLFGIDASGGWCCGWFVEGDDSEGWVSFVSVGIWRQVVGLGFRAAALEIDTAAVMVDMCRESF